MKREKMVTEVRKRMLLHGGVLERKGLKSRGWRSNLASFSGNSSGNFKGNVLLSNRLPCIFLSARRMTKL